MLNPSENKNTGDAGDWNDVHSFIPSFIHSFIPGISIAPLQVHY